MNKKQTTPTHAKGEWYKIPGFSQYCANRKGEIKNTKTGHVTQGGWVGHYLKVSVYPDESDTAVMEYTHRLVCAAFHGAPKQGQIVNHKDGDRLNLKPSNLEWKTQGYNVQHAYDQGLKPSSKKNKKKKATGLESGVGDLPPSVNW